jgi:hypothetical protein
MEDLKCATHGSWAHRYQIVKGDLRCRSPMFRRYLGVTCAILLALKIRLLVYDRNLGLLNLG